MGLLMAGRPRFIPATPSGIQQMLLRTGNDPSGKHVVVCGRSNIVGKPIMNLLMQRRDGANATVTVCHTRTRDLAEMTRQADILIAAVGSPQMITADMVSEGVVVIDVGVNRRGYRLVGDVDFDAVSEKAAAITTRARRRGTHDHCNALAEHAQRRAPLDPPRTAMTPQTRSDALRTSDYDYELPEPLIAQTPIETARPFPPHVSVPRRRQHTTSPLLRLAGVLRPGDVMVFNDSRVMPARLRGNAQYRGGAIELLLLSRISPGVWRAIGRPDGFCARCRIRDYGQRRFDSGEVLEIEPEGERIIRLDGEERLHDVGEVPLPPYITETLADSERYQTVYAREEGSAAAPTAGLHFTDELLERVRAMGVQTIFVTLHVGWGTFRPVKTDDPTEHTMHSEYWELSSEAADAIRSAKADGRRVISVGTTAVRLLENAASLSADNLPQAGSGWADIFITPGYRFKVVDALITNFHLPRSTLLMLVSALADRGTIMRAYTEAVEQRYRFYSFGDAMFIH
ncbi:S-adenosylmethionine:tRNA ribosyltransferase-isomerase [Geodia barretti]|uniref:S-adenosylmethionine:tRNA ribosyltransferase-isomerase n=1 Tax=Geodia barretti TaxID=519541 RepID=A0AA35RBA2_GEOBA|nr:S-adenosylmethionine:tRNA ribosyltransferase-isomerase [Geodia barretti]